MPPPADDAKARSWVRSLRSAPRALTRLLPRLPLYRARDSRSLQGPRAEAVTDRPFPWCPKVGISAYPHLVSTPTLMEMASIFLTQIPPGPSSYASLKPME